MDGNHKRLNRKTDCYNYYTKVRTHLRVDVYSY